MSRSPSRKKRCRSKGKSSNNPPSVTMEFCKKFNDFGNLDPTAANAIHLMSLDKGGYYTQDGYIDNKPVETWNYSEPNASSNINAIKY